MVCKYTCKCTISQFNKAITEYYRLGKQGHCLNTHFFLVYICIGELGLFVQFHFEIVLLLLFSPRLTFFFFLNHIWSWRDMPFHTVYYSLPFFPWCSKYTSLHSLVQLVFSCFGALEDVSFAFAGIQGLQVDLTFVQEVQHMNGTKEYKIIVIWVLGWKRPSKSSLQPSTWPTEPHH